MPKINYRNKNGEPLPGVTTVIGIMDKPALIWWGYQQGLENHDRFANEIVKILKNEHPCQAIEKALNFAKDFEPSRLYDKRDKAADAGTLAHSLVEAHLKKTEKPSLDGLPKEITDKAKGCFDAFLEWERAHKFELVESERSLVSETYGYGGTIDIGAILGDLCILDIKTSKGIYIGMKVQVAAYFELWNENYPDKQVKTSHILRLGANGEFDHHYWPSLDPEWEIFKNCLGIYKTLKETGQKL